MSQVSKHAGLINAYDGPNAGSSLFRLIKLKHPNINFISTLTGSTKVDALRISGEKLIQALKGTGVRTINEVIEVYVRMFIVYCSDPSPLRRLNQLLAANAKGVSFSATCQSCNEPDGSPISPLLYEFFKA